MHSKPQKYKIRQHNFLTKFILCNRIFLFDYRDKINSFKELKNKYNSKFTLCTVILRKQSVQAHTPKQSMALHTIS